MKPTRAMSILGLTLLLALATQLGGRYHGAAPASGSPPPAQACVEPHPGLVSWWTGDGDARDIGDGTHGELQNGATFTTGIVGQAFQFDGVDDYVDVTSSMNLQPRTNSFTVEAWARTTALGGQEGRDIYGNNWAANTGIELRLNSANKPEFLSKLDRVGGGVAGTRTVNDGVWHHWVGVVDVVAGKISLYIDGSLDAESAYTIVDLHSGENRYQIGAREGNNLWQGGIDEVSFYNRALSADGIQDIFAAGRAGKCKSSLSSVGSVSVVDRSIIGDAKSPGVWAPVRGLSTAVHSRAGDNLEITVSVSVHSKDAVWLRATVDGEIAIPSDVLFKAGGTLDDGIRSFTFVFTSVSEGQHVVETQWFIEVGAAAGISSGTLTVNSASPSWGSVRLAVAAGESGSDISRTASNWEDIPGLSTEIMTTDTQTLAIIFSAEATANSGRFFARALTDGTEISDVVFVDAANSRHRGARSYTFIHPDVPAGLHDVRIQWRAENGKISIGDRTIAVLAAPTSTTDGGLHALGMQLPPSLIKASGVVDIPEMNGTFTTSSPSTSMAITWGGEVRVSGGPLIVRVLVDGEIVSRQATVIKNVNRPSAVSYTFVLKNLLPGTHSIRFQAGVDSGETASIGDRFHRVLFKRRSGAEFSQPYQGLVPRHSALSPKHAHFNSLVICFDPVRTGHAQPTAEQLANIHQGCDGGLNLQDWFLENAGNRMRTGTFRYSGCDTGNWNLAPGKRQGTWYWDEGRFDLMWKDAILAADADIDFHSYDLNGDNHLTSDEIVLIIARPEAVPYGTWRPGEVSVKVDGRSKAMKFDIVDMYYSADVARRRFNVGILAHEVSHAVINAWDLHSCDGSSTDPKTYSIMDEHHEATHYDPFHKVKSAFVAARPVEINALTTRMIALGAVETYRQVVILYDPGKRNYLDEADDPEYFIIENRWPGSSAQPTYDSPLPSGGIVVWHVFEDASLVHKYPPPGGEACSLERNSVRKIVVLPNVGDSLDLKWADGSRAGVRVTVRDAVDQLVNVEIAKVP